MTTRSEQVALRALFDAVDDVAHRDGFMVQNGYNDAAVRRRQVLYDALDAARAALEAKPAAERALTDEEELANTAMNASYKPAAEALWLATRCPACGEECFSLSAGEVFQSGYDCGKEAKTAAEVTDEVVREVLEIIVGVVEDYQSEMSITDTEFATESAALATIEARLSEIERLRDYDCRDLRANQVCILQNDPSIVRVPREVLEENSDIVGGGGYGTGWGNFAKHLLREYGGGVE